MSKEFWIVIIITVVAFVGIFAVNNKKNNSTADGKKANSSQATEHKLGKGTGGVTLTEYGDYQCPGCGQFFPTVQEVIKKYGDQITFQFRNFPLSSIHPNAFAAARAAEAANFQGKFWEMNAMIYENQRVWSEQSDAIPTFTGYAQQLGLNMDQFKKDMASSKVNDLINADLAAGTKKGVSATPTFFINDKKMENLNNSVESFSKAIDAALAEQNKSTQQ